jgi:hypothetical protein
MVEVITDHKPFWSITLDSLAGPSDPTKEYFCSSSYKNSYLSVAKSHLAGLPNNIIIVVVIQEISFILFVMCTTLLRR